MKPAPFFVACLFLALLAAAPFPLGYRHFTQAAFSMKHNRYGYALTALVCSSPSCRRRPAVAGSSPWRFLHRVGLRLLLFLKISYGLVALTFAAVSLLLRSGARIRLAGMAAGFAAFSVPMMAYLRFDLPALVQRVPATGQPCKATGSAFLM
jgi:hypothetical protein